MMQTIVGSMSGVSRDRIKVALILLVAVIFSSVLSIIVVGSQGDDTRAFLNGTVITMDDDLPVAEAVLIRDGLIIAVGSDEEISILGGDEADVIDLQGRTLLPGFIDAHSHWLNDLFEVDSIEEAIDMSIRHGWTSISSLFTYPELIDELLVLDAQGEIRNRVNLYLRLSWQDQRWTDWYTDYPPGEMLTPMIRVAGVKMFADGTLGSATAAFSEPYPDDPYNYGSLFFTQEELDRLVNETHDSGYQIAIHAIGDAAIEQVLNAYEAALGDESNEKYRHRVEHVFFLRDDLIQRMASKSIIASFQNHWATSDNFDWYVNNLGPERVSLLARWRDLLDSGVPSAASTDYPYCAYGATAIRGLFSSVTRIGPYWGLEPSDSLLAQRLSVEEALRLITIDAAYATFQENVTGSITPGKYADLVVLSGNPLEVQPEELIDLTVWMTVIGGNIEYWRENPGTYTLSVDVEGPGRTHLAPGEYDYPSGFKLNFDALPGSPTTDDAAFSHWLLDGDNIGSMGSISVTMDSDHDLTAVFVEMRELALFEGWNLIGLPLTPEDPSTEVVLADILDKVTSVWAFDGETKTWSSYSPGAPSNLVEMVDDRGYWIKMTEDATLTVRGESADTCELALFEGWNLIGLPLNPEDPSIEVVLADVLDDVNSVWAFDGETKTWSSYSPGAPSNLNEMIEDRGYWIKVNTDCILTLYP